MPANEVVGIAGNHDFALERLVGRGAYDSVFGTSLAILMRAIVYSTHNLALAFVKDNPEVIRLDKSAAAGIRDVVERRRARPAHQPEKSEWRAPSVERSPVLTS